MNFLDTYEQLGLPTNLLFARLTCSNSYSDTSGNGNTPTPLTALDPSFLQPNLLNFQDEILEFEDSLFDDFSFFIDFSNPSPAKTKIILSSIDGGAGFVFGCSSSGRFFISTPHVTSGKNTVFFRDIITPARSILIFSRSKNMFELGFYEPFSGITEFQQIILPQADSLDGGNIKIGKESWFDYNEGDFECRNIALVSQNLLNFLKKQLAATFNFEKAANNDSYNQWAVIKTVDGTVGFESYVGANKSNIEIRTPISKSDQNFSISNLTLGNAPKFFFNGEEVTPDDSDDYSWNYGTPTVEDWAFIDNFSSANTLDISDSFTKSIGDIFHPPSPLIIYRNGVRLTNEEYFALGSNNMCFGFDLLFDNVGLEQI